MEVKRITNNERRKMKKIPIDKVTKKFLDGALKDLEYTENTFHGFELNKIYSDCVTGNKYQIVSIEKIFINI
jgi:hypothetical protein